MNQPSKMTIQDESFDNVVSENEAVIEGEASPVTGGYAVEQVHDDEEEAFVYPGTAERQSLPDETIQEEEADPVTEYKNQTIDKQDDVSSSSQPATPNPVDYGRLVHLCSSGPLTALKSFFEVTTSPPPVGTGVSSFFLANEPNPASGLVPIHIAAKEGRVDILKWLIKEVGAIVEMEDREGETAVHKAAMAGKLPALTFLISSGASADCVDGDGWTPLHNACSRGFLDIAKMLIETANAPVDSKAGRGGWTPLMNAASNGHLPLVRYLTVKQQVDPFIRNSAGETAYDVAAATFEIFICDLLQRYESERWATLQLARTSGNDDHNGTSTQLSYNPLVLHTTIAIVLYENQRLDTRLSTLTLRGGKPRWSGTQAGRPDKPDRRAPGTMPPGPLSLSRTRHLPMSRDDVRLPLRTNPYRLRIPNRGTQMAAARRARGETVGHDDLASTPTPESVIDQRHGIATPDNGESSHFWLSDWQTDFTHPQVDADQGWQYAPSFDVPEERWVAEIPPPLARLLDGRGLGQSVHRAVNSVMLSANGAAPVVEAEAISSGWVRRRRWVRVMRRRLDVEFGDDLEDMERAALNENADSSASNGSSLLKSASIIAAQQEACSDAQALGLDADYVSRSKAMAGFSIASTGLDLSSMDDERMKKLIARLEVAVSELRQHAFSDSHAARQQEAEDLLKEYVTQLGQLRQTAGLDEESEDEDEDEEFIYPNSYKDDGQSVVTRIGGPMTTSSGVAPSRPSAPQRHSSSASALGERVAPSEHGGSLGAIRSADLANAQEFRVPTHEVPTRPSVSPAIHHLREQNLVPTWERDHDAPTCRGCSRKFTFFIRKHHCRRCGRIFCDSCSSQRAQLSPDELIIDPEMPEMLLVESAGPSRICDPCEAERRLPEGLRNFLSTPVSNTVDTWNQDEQHDNESLSDVSSRASELNECPVCGRHLSAFGHDITLQEEHVRQCLDNGGGGSSQGGRYLVYKLSEGPIVGKECQICLEELNIGMTIARLPCLCYYHRHWYVLHL